MTNFDYYTETPARLDELLYGAVDDALSAKGCALKLKFPPDDCGDWESWLESEYVDGLPKLPLFPDEAPQYITAERHNAQVVTDGLQDIPSIIQSNPTPFAQALRDILNEAIGKIQGSLSHGT